MSERQEVAYRSDHPDVLVCVTRYQDEMADWERRLATFTAEQFGDDRRPYLFHSSISGTRLGGFEVRGDEGRTPPAGWRVDRKHWMLVPFRTKKEGKAIAKAFDLLDPPQDPRQTVPGMPSCTFAALPHIYSPAMHQLGDAVYVKWPVEPTDGKVDADIWQRIPLSEFYAAVEAHEAAGATA